METGATAEEQVVERMVVGVKAAAEPTRAVARREKSFIVDGLLEGWAATGTAHLCWPVHS